MFLKVHWQIGELKFLTDEDLYKYTKEEMSNSYLDLLRKLYMQMVLPNFTSSLGGVVF